MITSKDNEKLKLVRKLAERKWREREGLFVTEGEDLLETGAGAGFKPHLVLSREGTAIDKGEKVEAALLDAVSQLGSGTRVIAVWALPGAIRSSGAPMGATYERFDGDRANDPSMKGSDARLGTKGPCVYLHGVGDPGNVGSIVRSAAAFGASGVVLGPGCADAYGPKALRGSMGAIFALPVLQSDLEATPAPRLSLVAHDGAANPPPTTRTLCLGSERDGLPREIVDATDATWTIPTAEGAVESLGVAAAAAIALSRIGSPASEEWA